MHHSFYTNYHILGFVGNDVFYKHLNDWSLELFGPTIRTWWNGQSKFLKDELIACLVHYYILTQNPTAVMSDFRHFPVACTTL